MNPELEADIAGRDALVANFDRLPISATIAGPFPEEALELLGFTIGEEVDEIFMSVTPPAGWRLVATDNVLMTEIRDEAGIVRGTIFYKAWPYQRHAYFSLSA